MKSLFVACFACYMFACTIWANDDEKNKNPPRYEQAAQLKRTLLHHYDSDIIPAAPAGDSKYLEVGTGLSMSSMDLNDKGELQFVGILKLRWNDIRLAWEHTKFPDVEDIRLPAEKIWIPDIELFNSVDFGADSFSAAYNRKNHLAVVFPNGDVVYHPPVHGKVLCSDKEFADWPWGAYNCSISIGSWVYHGFLLELIKFEGLFMDFINTDKLSDNSPAFFTNNSFLDNSLRTSFYTCCSESYPELKFEFQVQKRYRLTEAGREENPQLQPAFESPPPDQWI